jgi:hypothetical protein
MTPRELLDAARDLVQRPDVPFDGIWPRAAALLARQAIEAAMRELWVSQRQAAALSECSLRSQELCLATYLDPETASRATYLLGALSHACHYHPYELAPTGTELTSWLDQATQIVTQIQAASTASAAETR